MLLAEASSQMNIGLSDTEHSDALDPTVLRRWISDQQRTNWASIHLAVSWWGL
jgi:hypothetical protein